MGQTLPSVNPAIPAISSHLLTRAAPLEIEADAALEIPAGAVVVPGARAIQTEKGRELGLSLYAPVIVKYRDEKTDAATQLEDLLR